MFIISPIMPLSPSQTRTLLEQLAHQPNKKLGQNFLVDGNIVRKSVELAELRPGDAVVEVGPGLGTLTSALLDTGAEVWAVERDPTLAEHLRAGDFPELPTAQTPTSAGGSRRPQADTPRRGARDGGVSACRFDKLKTLSLSKGGRLHLTEGDCLDEPRAALPASKAATGYKIVANLPYAVSTPWMEAVLAGPLPSRMVLMLQKEAGDRYSAAHGSKNFGAISIFLQSAYTIADKHLVAAACFHPVPQVDSILLCFDLKPDAVRFTAAARKCVRQLFTQRRKQLGALCRKAPEPAAREWFDRLVAAGLPPTARPEEVPLQHWQALARTIT